MTEQPDTQSTRAVAEQFFAARNRSDAAAMAALLTDDATYTTPKSLGQQAVVGRDAVAAALGGGKAGQFFDVDTLQRATLKVVVDGSTAVGLTTMTCTTRNGQPYSNEYAWELNFAGDKVRSVKEFTDSLYFARTLGIVN